MRHSLRSIVLSLCFAAAASVSAQKPAAKLSPAAAETRAIRAFNAAKSNPSSPLALHAFLIDMPKGADLHMHLTGSVYAETFLVNAAADHLCINPVTLSFEENIGTTRSLPPQPVCAEGNVAAASAFKDQKLYDALIDSFSMRSFVPTPGTSGHDQFFATFDRFNGTSKAHLGEWLDELATRAASQNEQYLEIMQTPIFANAARLGYQFGWPEVPSDSGSPKAQHRDATREELSHLRDQLLAAGLRSEVATDRDEFATALAARNRIEHCGEPAATAACSVKIRFLGQVLRAFPPQQVFAQTLLYFELASADPDVVGLNFVQPEDAYMSMSEYHRQMLMLDYLHSVYPRVHITLHAGELAPGLVPPEGLRFHIREAVDLGHAERIGHGVDILYERDPHALLQELATRHIMVEINLTSNAGILNITGSQHPLPIYRAAHVPVALSTDDEGVNRSNITHEYTRAALEFNLTYLDLKNMARTSLEHSFLPGPSLWQQPDNFTRTIPACANQPLGSENPTAKCLELLRSSDKAAQQWQLEHRYQVFEANIP